MPSVVLSALSFVIVSAPISIGLKIAGVLLLNTITAKLNAPKIPSNNGLRAQSVTIESAVAYHSIVYGQAIVSGPVGYRNIAGSNNEDLWIVIPMLRGRSNDLVSIWLDGDEIPKADIAWTAGTGSSDGTGTGNVTTSQFVGDNSETALKIRYYLGHDDQPAPGSLVTAVPQWTTSHRLRGITHAVFQLINVRDTQRVWDRGVPQNYKAVWQGRLLYDPRKYALNGNPTFTDLERPLTIGQGLHWFGNVTQTNQFGANADSFSVASETLTVSDNDDTSNNLYSERIPVDTSKRYTVRIDARQTSGDRQHFLGVVFYDANGDNILASGDSATGWASKGSHFYFHNDAVFAGTYTEYSTDFGVGGTAEFPQDTTAVEMAFVALLVRDGAVGTDTTVDLQEAAIHEYVTTRHDFTDSDTWEWSDNPAICAADYKTQIEGTPFSSIDWASVITGAQACDVEVDIPTASTEKRFTCNGVLSMGNSHRDNERLILSSCAGHWAYSQGAWKLRVSVWDGPTQTLTKSNFAGPIEVRGSAPERERFNFMRGVFIDPSRKYELVEFQHVTKASYVTRDGGKELDADLEFSMTNSHTMAQRLAIRELEQANNQELSVMELNLSGMKVAIGEAFDLDFDHLGYSSGGNLFDYSEEFDQWTALQATVTADTEVGPFATLTADSVVENTANAIHRVRNTDDGTDDNTSLQYTYCAYLKANGRTKARLIMYDNNATGNQISVLFDLGSGHVESATPMGNAVMHGQDMQNIGDGWYRCTLRGVPNTAGGATDGVLTDIVLVNELDQILYTGDGSSGIYVYGAQLLQGLYDDPLYVKTTGSEVSTLPKTFRCIEWNRNQNGGVRISAREDVSTAYDDPAEGDYDGVLGDVITVPGDIVPPPSNLAASGEIGGIQLTWTNPPSNEYDWIVVYEDTNNSWAGATEIARTRADSLFVPQDSGVTRYYWIRALREPDLESIRDPDNDTTTISATSDVTASNPVTAVGASLTDIAIDPDDAEVAFRVDSDGDVYTAVGLSASFTSIGTWMNTGANTDYQVRLSSGSDDDPTSGSSVGSWLDTDSDRTWTWTETVLAGTGLQAERTVEWRDKTTMEILGSATLDVNVDVEP